MSLYVLLPSGFSTLWKAEGTEVITIPGTDGRTARVHLPEMESKANRSAVLVLHGAGMTGWLMEAYTGLTWNKQADRHRMVVVYPEASWFAWSLPGLDSYSPTNDLKYLKKLVNLLEQRFRVDRDRMFVAGISNGAMMSAHLLCDSSFPFEAGAIVAGFVPNRVQRSCQSGSNTNILIAHGTKDTFIPYKTEFDSGTWSPPENAYRLEPSK